MGIDASGEAGDISLVALTRDYDPVLLTDFYSTVMAPSFAATELVSLESLRLSLAAPEPRGVRAVVAVAPDGHAVGGIVGEWYRQSQVLLLAYLAVRWDLRGRGIATRLMGEAVNDWCNSLKPLLVLGEVDDPRHFAVHPRYGDPAARLRLYERLGAKVLRMPYLQPEITPPLGRVRRMLLLAFYVDPSIVRLGAGRELISGHVLERFLREYFIASEGPSCLEDPELRRLLALAARPEGIALLAANRYEEVRHEELRSPSEGRRSRSRELGSAASTEPWR